MQEKTMLFQNFNSYYMYAICFFMDKFAYTDKNMYLCTRFSASQCDGELNKNNLI